MPSLVSDFKKNDMKGEVKLLLHNRNGIKGRKKRSVRECNGDGYNQNTLHACAIITHWKPKFMKLMGTNENIFF